MALTLTALVASVARADRVDDLSRQLRADPDYKVRLSAALNLGKLGDRRGIAALVDGLSDRDRTVRGVAIAALVKLIDARVEPSLIKRARAALEHAAAHDPNRFVRKQARKALAAFARLRPKSGVYVEVGPMGDATRHAPQVPSLMRKQLMSSLSRKAPGFLTQWPSGRPPSGAELRRSRTTAFYIDGSLTALTVTQAPPHHVTCAISVMLATYPQKSMFGFAKGGAEVDAASLSERAVGDATSDCVSAVLDDLVASELVPTIMARVPRGM